MHDSLRFDQPRLCSASSDDTVHVLRSPPMMQWQWVTSTEHWQVTRQLNKAIALIRLSASYRPLGVTAVWAKPAVRRSWLANKSANMSAISLTSSGHPSHLTDRWCHSPWISSFRRGRDTETRAATFSRSSALRDHEQWWPNRLSSVGQMTDGRMIYDDCICHDTWWQRRSYTFISHSWPPSNACRRLDYWPDQVSDACADQMVVEMGQWSRQPATASNGDVNLTASDPDQWMVAIITTARLTLTREMTTSTAVIKQSMALVVVCIQGTWQQRDVDRFK